MCGCCISETTIGIVIGSVFTLLGVIVNGLITFALNRSAHNREVEEHKRREKKELEDEKRAKREKAYREFASCFGFMNLLVGFAYATRGNQDGTNILGTIYQERISEVFGCIPHGARAFLNEVEKVGGGGHWTQSILLLVRLAAC